MTDKISFPLFRLFGNSWPMLAGFLINTISGFVVFLILLNSLSSGEYGQIVLYSSVVTFLGLIGSGGLQGVVDAKYHSQSNSKEMDEFLSTLFATSSAFMLLILIITLLLSLIHDPFDNSGDFPFLSIIAFACVPSIFSSHIHLGSSLLKISERTITIALISGASSLFSVILAYFSMIHFDLGIRGALLTLASTSFIIGIAYSIVVFSKITRFKFNLELAKSTLLFGFPLMLTAATATVTNLGDRFVIEAIMGVSDVGIYNAGYQFFAMAISLGMIFVNGWVPIFFDGMQKDISNTRIFSDFASISSGLGALGFLTFIILFNTFQGGIIPEDYPGATAIFYIVCASCIPLMFHSLNSLRLLRSGRTKTILSIGATVAFSNVALNFALIPFFGVIGAAFSTFITSLASPFLSHFIAKKTDGIAFTNHLGISLNCLSVAFFCLLCSLEFSQMNIVLFYFLLSLIPAFFLYKERQNLVWK